MPSPDQRELTSPLRLFAANSFTPSGKESTGVATWNDQRMGRCRCHLGADLFRGDGL
jgi:hypothetical protein